MLFSALKQATRTRAFSTHAFVTAKQKLKTEPFYRKNWLSDPATYPVIATMGVAFCLVAGVGTSCIFYNPNVQINPNTRGSVIRPKQAE